MHEVHPLPHKILSFGLGWPHWSSPSEGTLAPPPGSRSVRDGKEPFVTSTWDSAQNLNLRQDDLRASRRYFITVGTRRLCGQEYCSSCWSSGVDVFSRLFLKSARQRGAREDDVQERGAICCAGTRHCADFVRVSGRQKDANHGPTGAPPNDFTCVVVVESLECESHQHSPCNPFRSGLNQSLSTPRRRQRKKTEKERREDERGETRQDKTRQERRREKREDERQEKRRSRQEKRQERR